MKRAWGKWALMVLVGIVTAPALAEGRSQASAPYFEAYAQGKKVENLPLAMTDVDVSIAGVMADVSLTQVYENRGDVPIEAVYVFPASARATVYAVTMTVGGRVVRADLRERSQARASYEQAKAEGRSTTLLEQQDVGAFRMNLANVLPGDKVKVELRYAELLVPTEGVYEFFFPNTAPQVKYERPGDPDSAMPRSDAASVSDFSLIFKARIVAGSPIEAIESPSHQIAIERPSAREAVLMIDANDPKASTRDFVLRYSLRGQDITTGALAYPEGDGGYLLAIANPPTTVAPASVTAREYIFVVDVSGSMQGQPLDVSKGLVRELFATMTPRDRFNVVLFSGGSTVLSPKGSLSATPETLERVQNTIDSTNAGGGTELLQALEVSYALPRTPGMSRSVIIVTDGAIAAGSDVSDFIRRHLDEANVFAFGIGTGLERSVIERIARAGEGEPFMVEDLDKGPAEARRMRGYIDRPVMTGIKAQWSGVNVHDVIPERIPDLFAERPIVLVARYRGPLTGKVVFTGTAGTAPAQVGIDLDKAYVSPKLKSVRLLWARKKIDQLLDTCMGYDCAEHDEVTRQRIIDLGLQYGVLTPYTSFVAVTEDVRTSQDAVKVNQPAVARPGVAPLSAPVATVGYGFSPSLLATGLQVSTGMSVPASGIGDAVRELAGHRMLRSGDGWYDASHRADSKLLRVRRDSAAYRRLLALRPELQALFELEGEVLVALGDYSVMVSARGFSDYADDILKAAVSR